MGFEINPQTLSLIIAGFTVLSFVVLCVVLAKVGATYKQAEQSKNIQGSLEALNETIEAKLKSLDERLSRDQQQLFNNIIQDRERQLNSIGELRVELEKRFSETGLSLTNNIQAFKADMVEKFEKLQRGSFGNRWLKVSSRLAQL